MTFCPVAGCLETATVGAHVQKDDSTDSSWYIYPLCKKHNGETGKALTVSDAYVPVPANVSKTCGK